MSALPIPRRSKRWTVDRLADPRVWAAYERATALGIHRGHLLSRNPHCHYCGKKLRKKNSTLDHQIPQSQGGEDTPGNLVLCCWNCNQAKGDRTPAQWVQDILAGCVTD